MYSICVAGKFFFVGRKQNLNILFKIPLYRISNIKVFQKSFFFFENLKQYTVSPYYSRVCKFMIWFKTRKRKQNSKSNG